MRVLVDGQWIDGFLDYHRPPQECLIDVAAWKNLEQLKGLYIVRKANPWIVWNYIWDIGPRQTWRKVSSRNQERHRNEKFVACGVGFVREIPAGSNLSVGQLVVFLAPCHPRLAQRIVLPIQLLKPIKLGELPFLQEQQIICEIAPTYLPEWRRWWALIRGWSPHSGTDYPPSLWTELLDRALETLRQTDWSKAIRLPISSTAEPVTRVKSSRPPDIRKKSAVLFGYGNYAKNIIIPNVRKYLDVRCIHELDPLQIPLSRKKTGGWDTGAKLREDEDCEVCLIAGHHHSHVPLAIQALEREAFAVVEKPIAVDKDQLQALVTAMSRAPGKIFCCFHKRYSDFNRLAYEDLNLQPGQPISYHCLVYEVPMPPLHWYRWPNSKSRLITNGCHWIDHFLYLNRYSAPRICELLSSPDLSTLNCAITLANGAYFTMVMTYNGSERIGPQDYIELRSEGRSVRIINESEYLAESQQRILRKKRINRMRSYEQMYRQICQRISLGSEGDSVASVTSAVEIGLQLEASLHEFIKSKNKTFEEKIPGPQVREATIPVMKSA